MYRICRSEATKPYRWASKRVQPPRRLASMPNTPLWKRFGNHKFGPLRSRLSQTLTSIDVSLECFQKFSNSLSICRQIGDLHDRWCPNSNRIIGFSCFDDIRRILEDEQDLRQQEKRYQKNQCRRHYFIPERIDGRRKAHCCDRRLRKAHHFHFDGGCSWWNGENFLNEQSLSSVAPWAVKVNRWHHCPSQARVFWKTESILGIFREFLQKYSDRWHLDSTRWAQFWTSSPAFHQFHRSECANMIQRFAVSELQSYTVPMTSLCPNNRIC